MLNQASILNRKGLPHQALALIKKVKLKCKKYEQWYLLLQALELERNIMYAIQNPSTDNVEEKETLEKALELSDFRDIQSQLWKTFVLHGLPTDPSTKSLYSNLKTAINDKVNSTHISTFEAKLIHLYCQQFIAGMEGNIQETHRYGTTLLQTMDENPSFMTDKLEMYIRTLINLQYAQIRLFRSQEVIDSRKRCLDILSESTIAPTFKFAIRVSLFVNQYDMAFKEQKFNALHTIIKSFALYINENKYLMNPSSELLFNWQMAIHHFIFEQYEHTLEYNNKIIQEKLPYRNDIQALARLMNLIAYFELDQLQLLRPFTLNTYRYLKNKKRLHPIESFLIDFIRKDLAKHHFFRSLDKAFFMSYQRLLDLKGRDDSHETLVLMYFEHWLQKKIKKQEITN